MDASAINSDSDSLPSKARPANAAWPHHLSAAILVLTVHALLGALLLGAMTNRDTSGTDAEPLRLRWLPAPLPPQAPAAPALPSASQRAAPRPSTPSARRTAPSLSAVPATIGETGVAADPSPTAQPAPALDLRVPAGALGGGDGIDAETVKRKLIGRRSVHPAFLDRPPRFRMRPQMSPEQVLQGIGQFLGLWPPGYKVDPCELARQDAQYFEGAVEGDERERLKEAWKTISARCR